MPIDYKELLSVLATVCDQRGVTVTVSESLKGGMIVGAASAVCSVIFGPAGLLVGGILGGTYAASRAQNTFRPIAQVIQEDMTATQKQMLVERVLHAFEGFDITDVALLSSLLINNRGIQASAISTVIGFLEKELKCQVNQALN